MASSPAHSPLAFVFGVLGNITSFVVFLAPVPTFVRICKKKSTEGFHPVPYLVALFSAMLLLYYGMLKSDAFLLVTINSFGCLVEVIYIVIFIFYARKNVKVLTLRVFLLMNFGGFGLFLFLTHFFAKGPIRVKAVGWACTAFSLSVFAAPLSIMRAVIRTKSVEFMPFHLSFFLTLSAIMWLCYGLELKDFYIAGPNVLGFILGALQMVLYFIYKKREALLVDSTKLANQNDVEKAICVTIASPTHQSAGSKPDEIDNENSENENRHDQEPNDDSNKSEAQPSKC